MSPSLFRLANGSLGMIYLRKMIMPDTGVTCMPVFVSSDNEGETWSEPFRPFAIPDGRCGVWNGLYLAGDTLFAMTSANFPQTGIYIRSAQWQEP